ncbi:MAG: hypothetical protein IPM48_14540 [Saprospiraceae bacterium]|nr:hypothetical protein [Saprospiraceae bacterium]
MILSSSSLSGITEKPSIVEDIDYILGTDSTVFPLADKLRLINKWYLKVGLWIWQAQNTWQFDDKNATTLPRATTTLVNNQRDYSIPTTALSVERVEVMDKNGDYRLLEKKDRSNFEIGLDNEDAGMPKYWDLEGYSVILYPKPTSDYVTLSSGLRLFLSRQVTKFTKSDSAVEPGFEEQFHEFLSKGPSFDFALSKNMYDKANALRGEINQLRVDLENFYRKRTKTLPTINPKKQYYV